MSIKCQPLAAGTYTVSSGFGARWGTTHYGQDYACPVGTPLYAVADGIVVQGSERPQGSVSGFGSWIWLDCQASIGQDIIYGHVDHAGILVQAGDRVTAGQIIGHSGNEGASTGPHCHVECWSAPGRLGGAAHDPATFLADATEPGGTTTATGGTVSTIFGPDVSYFQNGMSLVKAKQEGMSFVILRTNDGTFKDTCYASHYDDAKNAGLLIAAYAYIRNPSEGTSIAAQVQTTLQVMGDRKVPVWLDCETNAGLHVDHIRAYKRGLEAAGVRVPGIYTYVPFWEGKVSPSEPDMAEFGHLWKAAYPGGTGTAAQVYSASGGDGSHNWTYPLGNRKPDLWQFTDRASVAGYQVDCNAFKGTEAELRAVFYGGTTATSEEDDMFTDEDRAALLDCRAMLQTLCAQDMGDPGVTGPYGGWPHDQIMASVREKLAAGKDLTRTEQLHALTDKAGIYKEK